MKRLIIGLIVFFLSQAFFSALGLSPLIAVALAVIAAFLVASRFSVSSSVSSASTDKADAFVPDFRHDNIAISSPADKLWVRDKSGKSAILDKADILRWNLAFTSFGIEHTNSRIEIHVRDLNRPMWSIPFKRHSDTWKWSARNNYAEAEEWQSRLTTWLQS